MRSRNRSIESSLKNMKQSKTRDALGANSQFCAQAPPSNCSVAVKVKIPETCKRECRDKRRDVSALKLRILEVAKKAIPLLTKNPPSVRKNSRSSSPALKLSGKRAKMREHTESKRSYPAHNREMQENF